MTPPPISQNGSCKLPAKAFLRICQVRRSVCWGVGLAIQEQYPRAAAFGSKTLEMVLAVPEFPVGIRSHLVTAAFQALGTPRQRFLL